MESGVCYCDPLFTGQACEKFKGCPTKLNATVCAQLLESNGILQQIELHESASRDSGINGLLTSNSDQVELNQFPYIKTLKKSISDFFLIISVK